MAGLRPYQARAVHACVKALRASREPALLEAATGAGKSHIIAEVARIIHEFSGKRVLCLAPSAELVTQNRAKYLATGNPCSLFSASGGGKETRHPVVFGTPMTVANNIARFQRPGADGYALVILDEAHGITPTVQAIITQMRKANENLRVLGLTATPYRLGSGYIFARWPDGRVVEKAEGKRPYFGPLVDRIGARELIAGGYLTPPIIGEINAERYATDGLTLNSRGQFDAAAVDRAYHGHGRKTAAIVADVVNQALGRRGVMFFSATVQHAREVMASLPPELSALVTGETPMRERESILRDFKSERIKYLVNVAVLTTGFDASHVDVIAILRKTESFGLLQQIIGRGLRLHPGKTDCLILDYTTNIEDHCPDGDLFSPKVRAGKDAGESCVNAECEWCGFQNEFKARPDFDGRADRHGYALDLAGQQIMTEHGPMPAHLGRRCQNGAIRGAGGTFLRCEYRWTSKKCAACDADNDIAARYCRQCKAEMVDPNKKLRGEWLAKKRDPTKRQTDRVQAMNTRPGISRAGNNTMRVEFSTPHRSFCVWLMPEATHARGRREWAEFSMATQGGQMPPRTITYQKDPESGFYRVLAYNQPEDVDPTGARDAA